MSEAQASEAPGRATSSLEDRYGSGRRGRFDRRLGWVAAALLLLGGIGYLIGSGWQDAGLVEVQNIGSTKQSDQEMSVKFTVTGPESTPIACAIEALSTSKGTVGWSIIELPVTDQGSHTVTTRLLTTTPATAAHARECWILEM